mmetsp:Transcript_44502/g.71279  ORF Transcript_44502/g.71279 Transcript_44502/m.71279 type:complete len:210 (-) Transcript_44502:11-640(-)
MHGGHQAFLNAKRVIQHLHHGRQTVCGARRVGKDLRLGVELVRVDVDAVHGRSLARRRDDHLLSATSQVLLGAFAIVVLVVAEVLLEDARTLRHIHRTSFAPRDLFRVALLEHLDRLAVHDQRLAIRRHGTVEATLRRVVFELVHHVIWWDERIIDSHNLHVIAGRRDTQDHAANTSKTIDSDFQRHACTRFTKIGALKGKRDAQKKSV